MTTWAGIGAGAFKHLARDESGTTYVDGVPDVAADTTMLVVDGSGLTLAGGYVFDELLFAPRVVDPAELLEMVSLGGPLHDPAATIDAEGQPVRAGTVLLDGTGVSVRDDSDTEKVALGLIAGKPNVPTGTEYGMWAGPAVLDAEGLTVHKETGSRQVKLGYIAGLSGVPAGVSYGLWGRLGTGVFIQGGIRPIATGFFSVTGNWSLAAGASGSYSGTQTLVGGLLSSVNEVPTGKSWILVAGVETIGTGHAAAFAYITDVKGAARRVSNGSWYFRQLYGGHEYDQLRIDAGISLTNTSASSQSGMFYLQGTWQVLEIDV